MDQDFSKREAAEKRKLTRLLKQNGVDADKIKAMESVIRNAAAMSVKLHDVSASISTEPLTVLYDNGGGQVGTRENPYFKAYENLLKSYLSYVNALMAQMPKKPAKEEVLEFAPQNALELIQNRRKSL